MNNLDRNIKKNIDKNCTVYETADFLGKRWTIVILLELFKGEENKKRYSEIKNSIHGITPKLLSLRLKELEREGLVTKEIDATQFPVKCEYSLTESGMDFFNIIKGIKKWALKWKIDNIVCEKANCKECEL